MVRERREAREFESVINLRGITMDKWVSTGKEFGLEGKDLLEFVKEQQEIERRRIDEEREERQRERESKKLEAEEGERQRQREVEEKQREREAEAREMEVRRRHEREMKELEVQQAVSTSGGSTVINNGNGAGRTSAKLPKLPEFTDGKDD